MAKDRHQRLDDESDETQVLLGCLTWGVEQGRAFSLTGGQTPVVVLT